MPSRKRRSVWSIPKITPHRWLACLMLVVMGTGLKGQSIGPTPGTINVEFSRIFVFVDKSGAIGHPHAIEGRVAQGNLHLSENKPGEIIFDMTTFAADTATARKYLSLSGETDEATQQKVDSNMRGPEVLDVMKFPQAKLENAKIQPTGKKSSRGLPAYQLIGDFTLHQTKRQITAECDVELRDGWQHVRGNFRIQQSDYGIKPFSKMFGAIGVKDELIVFGDLWVVPSP